MQRWGIALSLAVILLASGLAFYISRGTLERVDGTSAPRPAALPVSTARLQAWVFGGDIPGVAWERLAAAFREKEGASVQLTVFESEERYRQALRVAMGERRLPDVFLIESTESEALRQAGHVAMLDLDAQDGERWLPPALRAFGREGKTTAFPSEFSALALYYNRASFDRVGIAYPDVHWTWETFLAIGQAVYRAPESAGGEPHYALELPVSFPVWQAFASQAGGGLWAGGVWQPGEPAALSGQTRALTFLRDYARRYVIVPRPFLNVTGGRFVRGDSAMAIAGCELLRELRSRRELRWGVSPLPKDQRRATTLKARGWAVAATSRHPAEAARLARALATQPSRLDWLPSHAATAESARTGSLSAFYVAAGDAEPTLPLATAPEMEAIVNEELLRWINQRDPSPEAMVEWTRKMFPPQGAPTR